MERRNALRQMGASLGFVIAAPTLASLIQGCTTETTQAWTPQFLSIDTGHALKQIVDAILPKSDTPSASEVNVHIFMDSYANEVMDQKQQNQLKKTIEELSEITLSNTGKKSISQLAPDDFTPTLLSAIEGDIDLPFVKRIRALTIWGYKCTEYVGEEVLAYLPTPGQWIPCGDKEELTGGKAWSI